MTNYQNPDLIDDEDEDEGDDEELPLEMRKKKVRPPKREKVSFSALNAPQLAERLARLEGDLVNAITAADPVCADFLEWYEESARLYGEPVRRGLAALYWRWMDPASGGTLDDRSYAIHRDALADDIPVVVLDGEVCTGRTIMQEFVWWSAGDWFRVKYLVLAIRQFREYHAKGGMAEWRRKRRRRIAAARRRMIRETFLQMERTSPRGVAAGSPPPPIRRPAPTGAAGAARGTRFVSRKPKPEDMPPAEAPKPTFDVDLSKGAAVKEGDTLVQAPAPGISQEEWDKVRGEASAPQRARMDRNLAEMRRNIASLPARPADHDEDKGASVTPERSGVDQEEFSRRVNAEFDRRETADPGLKATMDKVRKAPAPDPVEKP